MSRPANDEILLAAVCEALQTQNRTLALLAQALVGARFGGAADGMPVLRSCPPVGDAPTSPAPGAAVAIKITGMAPPRATSVAPSPPAVPIAAAAGNLSPALLERARVLDDLTPERSLASVRRSGLRLLILALLRGQSRPLATAAIGAALARACAGGPSEQGLLEKAVPKVVDRLERAGQLSSERSEDGRCKRWTITAAGCEWLEREAADAG